MTGSLEAVLEIVAVGVHVTHLAAGAQLLAVQVHTEVRVAGEARSVVGTVSMDSFTVELDRELPVGAPVVLLGHGVLAEDHARVAKTINYELVCGIESSPLRARRTVIDA